MFFIRPVRLVERPEYERPERYRLAGVSECFRCRLLVVLEPIAKVLYVVPGLELPLDRFDPLACQ